MSCDQPAVIDLLACCCLPADFRLDTGLLDACEGDLQAVCNTHTK
jgi:hypothetical protein